MSVFAPLPLSGRIALAVAATISAAMASYGVVAERQQHRILLDIASRAAVTAASDAADGSVHHLLIGDYAAIDQLLVRLARNPAVARLTVTEPDGKALAEVVRAAPEAPPEVTAVPGALRPPAQAAVTIETSADEVAVWHPVAASGLLGWVRLVHRLDALRAAERAMATSAFALAVLWSLAATLLLLLLLRRPVVSIRRLADFARGLGVHKGDAVRVPSSSPEIAQLAAALNDASRELHQGEARLLAERQFLAVTLRSIADGVVATDAEGRVVLANAAAEALAACPPGKAVGRRFSELFPPRPDGAAGAPDPVARVLEAGRSVHLGEIPAPPGSDGHERGVAVTGAPIVGDGGGVVLVLRDVTAQHQAEQEHRRLQQAFEQAQKLESVGRLAGGVAHDFNNVLTVILGNIELALLNVSRDHPLAGPLGEMREAAESAAALTRQLLAFSRKSVIEPQEIELDERLERMAKMIRRLIGEDVVLRLEPGRVGRVRVDPGQLEQILINLAVNARDAMPRGGDLVIATSTERVQPGDARLAEAAPGDYAVITVADSGCGMGDDVKQHIFEPFFTTKEKGKGTGLGLSTVYGAVVQNRGFLQVESEEGRGTAFHVYLPRVAGEEAGDGPRPAAPETAPGGDETILIVEDEAPVRRLASNALERAGYRVIACASGGEALTAARGERGPIHLVLADVVMPGMDGPTLVSELVSIRPDARVLFVSGYLGDSSEALERIARSGATLLAKPYTPASLSKAVRTVLDSVA